MTGSADDAALIEALQLAVIELHAEVERLKEDYRHACATVAQMHAAATGRPGEGPRLGVIEDAAAVCAERDALRAEIERLRADAERYRWLRDCDRNEVVKLFSREWDDAIDAARGAA